MSLAVFMSQSLSATSFPVARRLCMTVACGRGSSNAYLFKGMVVSISANIDCNHDLNSYSYGNPMRIYSVAEGRLVSCP